MDTNERLFARTKDGEVHEVEALTFAHTDEDGATFGGGSVVLVFTDGTRALARECEEV